MPLTNFVPADTAATISVSAGGSGADPVDPAIPFGTARVVIKATTAQSASSVNAGVGESGDATGAIQYSDDDGGSWTTIPVTESASDVPVGPGTDSASYGPTTLSYDLGQVNASKVQVRAYGITNQNTGSPTVSASSSFSGLSFDVYYAGGVIIG